MKGILPLVNSIGPLCYKYLTAKDKQRLCQAEKRSGEGAKRERPPDYAKWLKKKRKLKRRVLLTNQVAFSIPNFVACFPTMAWF